MPQKVRKPQVKTVPPSDALPTLESLIVGIYECGSIKKRAEAEREKQQIQGIPLFKILGETTIVVPQGDVDLQGTLVEPKDIPVLDEEGFLKDLTAAQRKEVTKQEIDPARAGNLYKQFLASLTPTQRKAVVKTIVDKDKLDDAVSKGIVSMDTVADHTSLVPGAKPHIRVTATKSEPR